MPIIEEDIDFRRAPPLIEGLDFEEDKIDIKEVKIDLEENNSPGVGKTIAAGGVLGVLLYFLLRRQGDGKDLLGKGGNNTGNLAINSSVIAPKQNVPLSTIFPSIISPNQNVPVNPILPINNIISNNPVVPITPVVPPTVPKTFLEENVVESWVDPSGNLKYNIPLTGMKFGNSELNIIFVGSKSFIIPKGSTPSSETTSLISFLNEAKSLGAIITFLIPLGMSSGLSGDIRSLLRDVVGIGNSEHRLYTVDPVALKMPSTPAYSTWLDSTIGAENWRNVVN